MGIVRTADWRFASPPGEAMERIKQALQKLEMEFVEEANVLRAKSERSLRKNRWAAEVDLTFEPIEGGTFVLAKVDMLGNKHEDVLKEIKQASGLPLIAGSSGAESGAPSPGEARPDIQRARERMVFKLGAGRELRKLEEYLWPGEMVERMAAGTYGPGQGLIVLTDRRLFFLKDGLMSKVSEDFPLDKVSSVQWSSGLMTGTIVIFASANKAEIRNVGKEDGKAMVDVVRHRLSDPGRHVPANVQAPPAATPAPVSPDSDPLEQLRKLGALREAGILTEDEFNAKKAEILSRL